MFLIVVHSITEDRRPGTPEENTTSAKPAPKARLLSELFAALSSSFSILARRASLLLSDIFHPLFLSISEQSKKRCAKFYG